MSFQIFIDSILNGVITRDDEHWRPMSESCSLCNDEGFVYDVIIRLENYSEEEKYFIDRLEIAHLIQSDMKENRNPSHVDEEERREYFQTLTSEQISKLVEFYTTDLEIFQYDVGKYISTSSNKT